jgi:hypothetical protein
MAVRHDGRANPNQLVINRENQAGLAELREIVYSAHRERYGETNDLVLGFQLTHSGRFCRPSDPAKMEPRASRPVDRLRAISELRAAGIDTGVMIAPIIPGLTDHELPGILKAASEAGATSAIRIVLRLPHQLKALFFDWVQRHYPERAGRIERQVRSLHGGKLYDATFGQRGRGTGPLANQIAHTFEVFSRRYGLKGEFPPLSSASFRRPALDGQLPLFDGPASAAS